MTERDRKVLAAVLALVVIGGYWFLVLGKKRNEIKVAQEAQTTAQNELATAQAAEQAALKVAKVKPVAYSRLLRLGKAIPADDDFASLLVQINEVTEDAKVNFLSLSASKSTSTPAAAGVSTCEATGATGAPASPATGATPAGGEAAPTGSTSQTWVGKSRDKATGAVAASQRAEDARMAAAKAADCLESPTLTDVVAQAAGLQSEVYALQFEGSFYNLRDVYNGILDLVKVHNTRVGVSGRLLDISKIDMSVKDFPMLSATVNMTGYQLSDLTASNGTQLNATATSPEPAPAAAPAQ